MSVAAERSQPYAHTDEPARSHRHGWWWKALLSGALLWLVTIVVTVVTQNANLIPTLILIGSFLVPFSVMLFAAERINPSFTTASLMIAFFVGGTLGVLAASLLEAPLGSSGLLGLLAVGFIEELVKALIVVIMGRHLLPKTARQGALLGATVGAGFAAFESAGYAFNAALSSTGIDLIGLLQTEATRALLTPLGHVLWTAILGAVIFGASRDGRHFRFSLGIVGAYVLVAVLHGLWDSMSGIATVLAVLITGDTIVLSTRNPPAAAVAQVNAIATPIYLLGLAVVAVVGGLALWWVIRHHRSRDRALSEQVA